MASLSKGQIHGILMMLGFGWLLPLGVLAARFLKHRSNELWFQLHRALQLSGLFFGIVGFSIAVQNFDVFRADEKGTTSYQHGCLGVTVFVLCLLQPLVAGMRPAKQQSPQPQQEEVSNKRLWWERLHKGFGYLILLLVFITILLGTKMEGTSWILFYLLGVIGSLILVFAWMQYDRFSYSYTTNTSQ